MFLWTERDKERIRQTEGETEIPRGQVSGDMKLAGVLYRIVMLAQCTPLTCVGSLIWLSIDFIQLLKYPLADPMSIPCLHPAGQAASVHKGI